MRDEALANLVRQHRLARQLTQEQLSEHAGLSARSIQDLERGLSIPRRDTLERLIKALGLEGEERAAFERAARPRPRHRAASAEAEPEHVSQTSLPPQLTSFIGRERELGEVVRLLQRSRLLTLTGPGGIGKTRLAFEVAAHLQDEYADGVYAVELAPLMDPKLVTQTVASAVGVYERAPRPIGETLSEALANRQLLLVLDNCEHLVEACAQLVYGLLRSCPALRLLATSREPLGIAGEHVLRVPTLSLPEQPSQVAESEAGRLFVERAQAAMPGFTIDERNADSIARLCRRLDGIALAIELAAAWLPVLSVEQIVERLEDALKLLVLGNRAAPPRHQTLRGTLDWSYRLLSQPEQQLFDRLSVFAGGWTLSAVEAVCAEEEEEGIDRQSVLNQLAELVNKSLVVAEVGSTRSMRYRLLEPVRQYARERLADAWDADAVRRRHAAFFVEVAEAAEVELGGADREIWLEYLDFEHDNMRAALAWAESGAGDPEIALRIAGALSRFWAIRGHLHEGLGWLESAQKLEAGVPSARAKALSGAGWLALLQGDRTSARRDLQASLSLARQLHDTSGIAETLKNLGRVALEDGDVQLARACFTESLSLSRAMGYRWTIAFALTGLAQVAVIDAELQRARVLFEQALVAYRGLDSPRHVAVTLSNLAAVVVEEGDEAHAQALYADALALVKVTGDRAGLTHLLEGFAGLARRRGEAARAEYLLGVAAGVRASNGYPQSVSDHAWPDAPVSLAAGSLTQPPIATKWSFERALGVAEDEAAGLSTTRRPARRGS